VERELLEQHERQIAELMSAPMSDEDRAYLDWQDRLYARRSRAEDAPDEGENE
jgi:hypothetical protein